MGAAKFSWFKMDVIPVVASVVVGMGFSVYTMGRNIFTNPEVRISKGYRMEGVPESGTIENLSTSYNKGSLYRSFQKGREGKDVSEGRTRIF